VRRIVDVGVSLVLLVILSPVLILAALAVTLSSRGPAIYLAERVGKDGVRFRMLKFRTMIAGADRTGPGITAADDPRVTPVGRFLRATKIDELPQLVNVLRGDLTLIGPRAEAPIFVEHYTPAQRRLLTVRPGVTGPGQLFYSTDQQDHVVDLATAEEIYLRDLLARKLQMDLDYLDHRSPAQDLRILSKTFWVVVVAFARAARGAGASSPPSAARR